MGGLNPADVASQRRLRRYAEGEEEGELETKARHVRTPEGARRYKVPIGAPIPPMGGGGGAPVGGAGSSWRRHPEGGYEDERGYRVVPTQLSGKRFAVYPPGFDPYGEHHTNHVAMTATLAEAKRKADEHHRRRVGESVAGSGGRHKEGDRVVVHPGNAGGPRRYGTVTQAIDTAGDPEAERHYMVHVDGRAYDDLEQTPEHRLSKAAQLGSVAQPTGHGVSPSREPLPAPVVDNEFGGVDYSTPQGTVRTATEDGQLHVYSFDRNMVLEHHSSFSPDAPGYDEALKAALEAQGARNLKQYQAPSGGGVRLLGNPTLRPLPEVGVPGYNVPPRSDPGDTSRRTTLHRNDGGRAEVYFDREYNAWTIGFRSGEALRRGGMAGAYSPGFGSFDEAVAEARKQGYAEKGRKSEPPPFPSDDGDLEGRLARQQALLEAKAERHVRTAEGSRKYKLPIGAPIARALEGVEHMMPGHGLGHAHMGDAEGDGLEPHPSKPKGEVFHPKDVDEAVAAAARGQAGRVRAARRGVDAAAEAEGGGRGRRRGLRQGLVEGPKFDLCKVTVKGTNLFCVESKGIPRIKMPQLAGVPAKGVEGRQDAAPGGVRRGRPLGRVPEDAPGPGREGRERPEAGQPPPGVADGAQRGEGRGHRRRDPRRQAQAGLALRQPGQLHGRRPPPVGRDRRRRPREDGKLGDLSLDTQTVDMPSSSSSR
jgi:hypothetical protein